MTAANYDQVYWYWVRGYGFGFADTSSILLNPCDVASTDCASRLCWKMDINFGSGGYRAGCTHGLTYMMRTGER